MSLSSKVGAFNTSTAAAGNTVVVTGVGFEPKALIFWWAGLTATTDTFSGTNNKRGIGVATSPTSRWTVATQTQNAVAAANVDRSHYETACIATILSAGTVDGLMDLQSMDADGFTLIVDDAFALDYRIHYLALGGTDLTNVATGRWDEPAATGTDDVTSVGFQPDFALFGSIGTVTDPPAVAVNAQLLIGAAVSSSQQAVLLNIGINAADPMQTDAYCRAGECIAFASGASTVVERATFDSFLSNGFRLNWLEVTTSARVIFYLALKGGSYRINDFLTSISNGATIAETGFGFVPTGTMLVSHGRAADTQDVMTASDQWNVGGFTSTTERGSQGSLDEDNVADSDVEIYVEHDAALAQITTAPALVGLVDVQSVDADGFTLVMDSAADPAAFVWYISFGNTAGAAPYPYIGGGYYPTEG